MEKKDNNNSNNNNVNEDEIDLLSLLQNILQGKWTILFFTVSAFIIAFIYAYGQPPVYQANTLLRVEAQKSTIPGLDDLSGLMSSDDASVITEIELIKSRKILSEAVESLKLDIVAKPIKIPLLGYFHQYFFSSDDTKKLPSIWETFDNWAYPYAWGNEQIKVGRFEVPKAFFNRSFTIISKEDNNFELTLNDKLILVGKIGVAAQSTDTKFSIFIAKLTGLAGTTFAVTKLSDRRARSQLKVQLGASEKGKKTGILNLSIEGTDEELIVEILDKISGTYIEQNKQRSSKEASNALTFLEEQIKPVKGKVDRAEGNLRQYRTENQTADLQQETLGVLGEIVAIDAELQKLSLFREELGQKYTANHPKVKVLVAQQNKLEASKNRIQAKILKLPKKQQKLLELERDIKVSNTIYLELLNKTQEFKIAKASTVGNVYVVDSAEAEEMPVKPKKGLLIAVGVLVGFILGIAIVLLRQVFRRNVNNPETLEQSLGIPVYATVPLSKNVEVTSSFKHKKQKRLLAVQNMTDPAIESLRSLRTSLHFALHEAKNNIVLITGPSPGIGKSFISSNFSAIIANANQRVVLVDADMRKGYLHQIFGLQQTPGLSEIISGGAAFEDAATTVEFKDIDISLDVITRGKTPPNPSELLMNNNFEKLLKYLSANYDLVLIDSPPIHAVTDPAIIGSHAGVVFMVVRSEHHSLPEIEHAVSRLAQTGVETKGFIFNGFEAKKSGYGYGYGYGYKYYGEK